MSKSWVILVHWYLKRAFEVIVDILKHDITNKKELSK